MSVCPPATRCRWSACRAEGVNARCLVERERTFVDGRPAGVGVGRGAGQHQRARQDLGKDEAGAAMALFRVSVFDAPLTPNVIAAVIVMGPDKVFEPFMSRSTPVSEVPVPASDSGLLIRLPFRSNAQGPRRADADDAAAELHAPPWVAPTVIAGAVPRAMQDRTPALAWRCRQAAEIDGVRCARQADGDIIRRADACQTRQEALHGSGRGVEGNVARRLVVDRQRETSG